LTTWAERLAQLWTRDDDVYAFFNNDPCGCAVRDAAVFGRLLDRAGLQATRVPPVSQAPVGEC
jgi:uncharacterized protein YecE (DUF72 family)